jgi:hypothetical protein
MGILVITTVFDKAFALLLLENNWAKWKEQAYIHYKNQIRYKCDLNEDMELEKKHEEARKRHEEILAKAQ